MPHGWKNVYDIGEFTYHCGACGERTTGHFGVWQLTRDGGVRARVVISSNCGCPTYFESTAQIYPNPRYRQPVEGITDEAILRLYGEPRHCNSYRAITSAALLRRKILMHDA